MVGTCLHRVPYNRGVGGAPSAETQNDIPSDFGRPYGRDPGKKGGGSREVQPLDETPDARTPRKLTTVDLSGGLSPA